ncbi:uncharacterized protein CC84DRAFT_1175541 [Paraphaeosphaeria sporulosa]|uniref:Uncharacterized protein n=1 Tax=Paraphaeosphaeria sporulosa TaxID=1460663 RepID=A0A177CEM4_9PLEO|nr:uncharacterized protein CC84DRAFT_1175541 [Paraphaeosphaeria sporulosa]OAG05362.1 hypothetical protein CC84DRAFT_1175541 [Paraphaeosphaeria sporulosa]
MAIWITLARLPPIFLFSLGFISHNNVSVLVLIFSLMFLSVSLLSKVHPSYRPYRGVLSYVRGDRPGYLNLELAYEFRHLLLKLLDLTGLYGQYCGLVTYGTRSGASSRGPRAY